MIVKVKNHGGTFYCSVDSSQLDSGRFILRAAKEGEICKICGHRHWQPGDIMYLSASVSVYGHCAPALIADSIEDARVLPGFCEIDEGGLL